VLSQFATESILAFCERINTFIFDNYDIKHDILVYGDGANWIKTLAQEVGDHFILDHFHAMQALFRLCGGKTNTEERNLLHGYLKADKKADFFLIANSLYPEMSKQKQAASDYLKNNWASFQNNFKLPQALVCCAEGINSHYFASRLSSRPRGFSIKAIHNLGALLSIDATSSSIRQHLVKHLPEMTHKEKAKPSAPLGKYAKYQNNFTHIPALSNKTSGLKTLIKSLTS